MILAIMIISIFASPTESMYAKEKQDTHEFILHYECRGWPTRLEAYPDYKGYSIGCGTPSYKGERITKDEAYRRFYAYVDTGVALVKRSFPNARGDQLTALVSLATNNHTCFTYFRKHGISEWIWREKCDNVKVDGKLKELAGLHERRNTEADLYF